MFGAMVDRRCKGFVVVRFDRMNRSFAEVFNLIALVQSRPGLKIGEAERGVLDLRSANAIMLVQFLASIAEYEVRINRDRRRTNMRAARLQGQAIGQLAPGYTRLVPARVMERDDRGQPSRMRNLDIVPGDAEVIQAGWDYLFGKVGDDVDAYLKAVQDDPVRTESLAKVARKWNAHDWKREASTGRNDQVYRTRPWTGATVLNVLTSATMAAMIEVSEQDMRAPGEDGDQDVMAAVADVLEEARPGPEGERMLVLRGEWEPTSPGTR